MTNCILCKKPSLEMLLDLGEQPVCNRFLFSSDVNEFRHPMVLGYCPSCDLAQLINPVPAKELLPPFDWITYNEPEGHLDELVSTLTALPGITPESLLGGVSFKDDSTLRRFQQLGFRRTWRVEQRNDLGITHPGAGVEAIQEALLPDVASTVASQRGRADLLIVRHILEHAFDPKRFISSLKNLLSPDGYMIIEVPDCSKAFASKDFTTIWEEHPIYFTPSSFQRFFETSGLTVVKFLCYEYAFENSLVAIVKADGSVNDGCRFGSDEKTLASYASAFPVVREQTRKFLEDFRAEQGDIALFGAGHLACAYVNFFGTGDFFRFVVDDNPHKLGMFMPGSKLPIKSSKALLENDIKLALLCLSPEAEDKVIEKNRAFVEKGGVFASIFPNSRYFYRGVL